MSDLKCAVNKWMRFGFKSGHGESFTKSHNKLEGGRRGHGIL